MPSTSYFIDLCNASCNIGYEVNVGEKKTPLGEKETPLGEKETPPGEKVTIFINAFLALHLQVARSQIRNNR